MAIMGKPKRDHYPSVATAICVFTVKRGVLKVLLIERDVQPFLGDWALPGERLLGTETLEQCAQRELKTNVRDIVLEPLGTYSKVDRDPRGRVISVTYFALIPDPVEAEMVSESIRADADWAGVEWFSENHLPGLAFDHDVIVRDAIRTLRHRFAIEGANALKIASSRFTARQLDDAYNCLAPKEIKDYSNFWKPLSVIVVDETTDEGDRVTQAKDGVGARRKFLNPIKRGGNRPYWKGRCLHQV